MRPARAVSARICDSVRAPSSASGAGKRILADGLVDQLIQRPGPDDRQHGRQVIPAWPDMAIDKVIGGI